MKKTKDDEQGFSALELVLVIVVIALVAGAGLFIYHRHKKDTVVPNQAQVGALILKASAVTVPGVQATVTTSKYCEYDYPEIGNPSLGCENGVSAKFNGPNLLVDPSSSVQAVKYASDFLGQYYNLLKQYGYSYDVELNNMHTTQLPPVATYYSFNTAVNATPTVYYDYSTKGKCTLGASGGNVGQHSAIGNGTPATIGVSLSCSVEFSGKPPYAIKN